MITIKSAAEIKKMREAGRITAEALAVVESLIAPGVTTGALEKAARAHIESRGAVPSFLGYRGYPASINVSVNDQVIHGIPGNRKLKSGDIVSVDIGAYKNGFHGDAARTFAVGNINPEAQRLINVTRASFFEGIKHARAERNLHDISMAIQAYAEANGFSVVRDYIGHGVGKKLHESPDVPNYKPKGRGVRLVPGMTLAVEPMVNAGGWEVLVLKDGWTVVTADGGLSAHYENTVLITDNDPELLTQL